MKEPFFIMRNNHSENCGTPPTITNETANKYYGYFENEFGEQWVFVYDRVTKKAVLYGGDVEWGNEYQVKDGRVQGLILDQNELNWLNACWKAATAFD